MSDAKKLDVRDWWSVLRHTVYPIVSTAVMVGAAAAMDALEAEATVALDTWTVAQTGVVAALLSGGLRLWKRYRLKL